MFRFYPLREIFNDHHQILQLTKSNWKQTKEINPLLIKRLGDHQGKLFSRQLPQHMSISLTLVTSFYLVNGISLYGQPEIFIPQSFECQGCSNNMTPKDHISLCEALLLYNWPYLHSNISVVAWKNFFYGTNCPPSNIEMIVFQSFQLLFVFRKSLIFQVSFNWIHLTPLFINAH